MKINISVGTRNELWLTALFLVLLGIFMLTGSRAFLALPIYESLLATLPLYGFLALGLTLVVATGEMDLCFPATLAASGFAFALVVSSTGQAWLGMLLAMLVGLGIGFCNGLLVAVVGVPSIIATIGTQFFWRGVVLLVSQGLAMPLTEAENSPLQELFVGRLFDFLPMQAVWLVVLTLVFWLMFNHHPMGDNIRFSGENGHTAERLGIPVLRTRLGVHCLMGLTAGFAGVIGCMEMGSWWPTQGDGYMLLVFAAVFIGGTSVFGGSAQLYGTLVGIAIVGTIEAGIVSSGLSGFWTRAIHGLVIIGAVSCYALLQKNSSQSLQDKLRKLFRN